MLTEGKTNRINNVRIRHCLTIKQVSDITKVPYRTVQKWDSGERQCPDYVEEMVVNMIENHGKPNYKTFLDLLVLMLQDDFDKAKSDETKSQIQRTIQSINRFLQK